MIRKFTQGNALTVARLNELVDALNKINNFAGDGLIKVTRSSSGYTFNLNMDGVNARIIKKQGGGGGTSVRRAKIQTSGVGSSSLSCKFLDADGNEISTGGDNDDGVYTVYPVEHLGTNNLSGNVWPKLAANDIISVFLDVNGNYYTTFIFDDTDSCA